MKSIDTKSCVKKAQRHDKDAFTELMLMEMFERNKLAQAGTGFTFSNSVQ